MMRYQSLLKGALPTTIWLIVLSIILISLTAAYAIIGDFKMQKYVYLLDNVKDITVDTADIPIQMIEYVASTTDATIVSACVGLFTGIFSIVSWCMLRKGDMDREVNLPRRRFYVGAVLLTTLATFCSALAALILHFTQIESGDLGCGVESDDKDGQILYCTREIAACKVLPDLLKKETDTLNGRLKGFKIVYSSDPVDPAIVCNMTRAVKWMQLLLMLTALAVGALFLSQAIARHKNRYERMELLNKGKEGIRDDPSFDGRL